MLVKGAPGVNACRHDPQTTRSEDMYPAPCVRPQSSSAVYSPVMLSRLAPLRNEVALHIWWRLPGAEQGRVDKASEVSFERTSGCWCFGCTRNNHGTLLRVRVQSPFSKREMSFLSLSKGEKGKMGQALSVRHVHEFRYCDKNTWAILGLRSDTSEKGDSRLISKWQKTFNLNDVSGSNQYMGKIFFRYKICAIKF